jgi:hypothetical protein
MADAATRGSEIAYNWDNSPQIERNVHPFSDISVDTVSVQFGTSSYSVFSVSKHGIQFAVSDELGRFFNSFNMVINVLKPSSS